MLRWFVFTIAFGLLPFGVSTLLQTVEAGRIAVALASPALLFFSVMVCAAQLSALLGTLSAEEPLPPARRDVLAGFFALFLLGAVICAILYGVVVSHELNDPGARWATSCARPGLGLDECPRWQAFRLNLFTLSIWVAAFFAITGTISEWKRSTE